MSYILAIFRLIVVFTYTVITVGVLFILNALKYYEISDFILKRWCMLTTFILGFQVKVDGSLPTGKGVFIVSNHCSYIDIFVIGGLITSHFTPKSTVKKWPFIGQMIAASRPIYIERGNKRSMIEKSRHIANFIKQGNTVVVYPEGTTNKGNEVYPFKSGAFAFLEQAEIEYPIPVLPVTLFYRSSNGIPLTADTPSPVAWYGDATLVPHLWSLFKTRSSQVEVITHPIVTLADFSSRKALSDHCFQTIQTELTNRLASNGG